MRTSIKLFALAMSIAGSALAQPAASTPASNAPVKVDSETISGLAARNIGSAAMSGRVAALECASTSPIAGSRGMGRRSE